MSAKPPCRRPARLTTGGLAVHGEMLPVQTDERVELIDITDRVISRWFARG